jgi:hypothetical protein
MNEFFNWHDSWAIVSHHWFWMLIAALFGIWTGGWLTAGTSSDDNG